MSDSSGWASAGWLASAFATIAGMVYAVAMFVSGTRTTLDSHERRLREIEVSSREDIKRLEEKIDGHYTAIMQTLLQMKGKPLAD